MKLIPIKEYEAMWDEQRSKRRYSTDDLPAQFWIGMTCQNYSGPGTPFKDEYDRMTYEFHNPDIPRCMSMWTTDDLVDYYPDTPKNRQMKKDRG